MCALPLPGNIWKFLFCISKIILLIILILFIITNIIYTEFERKCIQPFEQETITMKTKHSPFTNWEGIIGWPKPFPLRDGNKSITSPMSLGSSIPWFSHLSQKLLPYLGQFSLSLPFPVSLIITLPRTLGLQSLSWFLCANIYF